MADVHAKCIKLNTITLNGSKYLPGGLALAHGASPTICMALYGFKMSLKGISYLILAAGDMVAGVHSQIVVAGHERRIKLTTIS